MKKENFRNLDDLHVPSEAKEKCLIRVNQEFALNKKERNRDMKVKGLLAACAAFAVVVGLIAINDSGTLDYEGYYNTVAEYVSQPQDELNNELNKLDELLMSREISIDDYLEEKSNIASRQKELNEKKQQIRTQYKINEDSLDTAKFNKNPEKNQQIVNNLRNEIELERREEELEIQEEKAIQDYRSGKISQDQLIQILAKLDAQDKILDSQEDQLENEQPDEEDLAEYQLANKLINGQITVEEYIKEKQQIEKKYNDIDDMYDDDHDIDDDDDDIDDIFDDDDDDDEDD